MGFRVLESGLLVGSWVIPPVGAATLIEQLAKIFDDWDKLCTDHGVNLQAGVAYTVYTPCLKNWEMIDYIRRFKWGESKPTSSFFVTNCLPDGRQWGDAVVAMEAVGVVGDCKKREIYLDSPSNISTYCHAKVVEDASCKQVFFSGVVALGSMWKDQPGGEIDYWVISPEIDHQVHYCLSYIELLCRKAEVAAKDIQKIDVFHLRSLRPAQVGLVVAKTKESYRDADLLLQPVDGFFRDFKDPILVEIRPHAMAWKE